MATAQAVGAEHRVTAYGWKALAGSVIGYSMDGFDMLILGFMLSAISKDLILDIAIPYSVQNFAYYGIMIWMPHYLAKSLGFSLTKSGIWTAVTVLGMACGIWAFGQLADRAGRKPIFILFQLGAVIMLFVYSRVTGPNTLLWVGAIMGMAVNGTMAGIGAMMSEAYPTAARATAQNSLFNVGRAEGAPGR